MVLFEEYAASFARGEHPDLREYLQRAGEGRDDLAVLVEGWLQAALPPEPSEEEVALMQAWLGASRRWSSCAPAADCAAPTSSAL
jgi:hypothetical protein